MTTGTGPPSAIEAVNPRYGLKTGAGLLHADYDSNGEVSHVTDPSGNTVSTTYT